MLGRKAVNQNCIRFWVNYIPFKIYISFHLPFKNPGLQYYNVILNELEIDHFMKDVVSEFQHQRVCKYCPYLKRRETNVLHSTPQFI
jgi:hypothetical protein